MLKLVVHTGKQAGTEFFLDRSSVRLGRDPGNGIVLQDSQSSRQHAEVSQVGDQIFIRDLDSLNGTFVNGDKVTEPRQLQPNDRIRIGTTVLICKASDAVSPSSFESDWEAELWTDESKSLPSSQQRRALIGGLIAIVASLIVIVAVAIGLAGGSAVTPTPIAQRTTVTPTMAAGMDPTSTMTPSPRPTHTPTAEKTIVKQTPATSRAPTMTLMSTPPEVTIPLPTSVPTRMPTLPAFPSSLPSTSGQLEELPSIVLQTSPGVSAENLTQVMAEWIQTMSRQQMQTMIAALFPGVNRSQLPKVVAASFPGLQPQEIEALLALVFPGQQIDLSGMDVIQGQLAVGIYDDNQRRHDLYLMNLSEGKPRLVVEQASGPSFAPDGEWLVYCSWASDRVGLRLIKADGTEDRLLTSVKEHAYPTYSPDGGRIAFYHSVDKILHVIRRDGTDRRDVGKGEYPAWSPTGDQIIYRGCVGGGRCGLIIAGADGSNPRQVTTHPSDAAPRWSPNGGQIVFHSNRDGNWEIYIINSDGSWLRRITRHPATDIMPMWSPDGLHLAFRSDRGGSGAVWATLRIGGSAMELFEAGFDPTSVESAQMDWAQ